MCMKICFVCHANVCRSFLAQEFFKKIISDSLITGTEVISRGVFAFEDCQMPQKNIDFLIKNGIEYKKHTPALIAKDDIVTSDLIFVMTNEQLELLTDKYAEFTDKIHLFLEFADNTKEDMPDPIGKTGKQFDKIATKIKEAVLKTAKKLNLTN
jgi:protein-tyrosine phosphatase